MARVLVTGGTGMLGRRLVPTLVERGHTVRVAARRPAELVEGAVFTQADVRTGNGLDIATANIDAVIHAATSPTRGAKKTEVLGIRNVLDAIGTSDVHLIYVSIVGVDRNRLPYYRAKWDAEQIVESSPASWTIQRATQFHDLLDQFLSYPLFPKTPRLAFQVVDAREVSARLADLVESGPSGRVPDFGGPDVVGIAELATDRERITGRRARLVRFPRVGPVRDFDSGYHHCPEQRSGHITWQEWLRTTA